jgi:hypothetical protein
MTIFESHDDALFRGFSMSQSSDVMLTWEYANGFLRFDGFLSGIWSSNDRRELPAEPDASFLESGPRLQRRRNFMTSDGFFHSGDASAIALRMLITGLQN